MTKDQKTTFYIFFLAILMIIWKIYVLYMGQRVYGYIVPPGDDPINHLAIVNNLLAFNLDFQYPPLFHIVIAIISRLTNIVPLQVMNYLTPLLVLLPPIAIYFFLAKNFSRLAGIIGFTVTILSSSYGLIAYGDGNYPNILAGGFFMPLALSFIVAAFKSAPKRNITFAFIFIILTALTHHLTMALFLVIFITYLIVLLIWNKFESITPRLHKIGLALVGCLVIGILVILLTPAKVFFLQAIASLRSNGSVLPSSNYLEILSLSETSQTLGELPFYLGLGALIYLAIMLVRDKAQSNKPAILLVMIWFFSVFLLSQTSFVSLPARIARETGLPLLLAIGIFIADILNILRNNKAKIAVLGIFLLFLALSLVQINTGTYRSPEFFTKMVWLWPEDKVKIDYAINKLPGVVVSNPSSSYLETFGEGKIIPFYGIAKDGPEVFTKVVETGADYILLINAFKQNPFEDNVSRNNTIKEQLDSFAKQYNLPIVKTFEDGSVVYEVSSPELTAAKNQII